MAQKGEILVSKRTPRHSGQCAGSLMSRDLSPLKSRDLSAERRSIASLLQLLCPSAIHSNHRFQPRLKIAKPRRELRRHASVRIVRPVLLPPHALVDLAQKRLCLGNKPVAPVFLSDPRKQIGTGRRAGQNLGKILRD